MHLSIIWCNLNYIYNDFSGIVVMDGSSFAKRISCLKFEPKVSNFPVIKATLGFYHQYYYEKSFGVVMYILEYVKDNDFSVIVVMDGSSLALQVSCLNYYEKSFEYENTLERRSDCFSNKMLNSHFIFYFTMLPKYCTLRIRKTFHESRIL